MPIVTLSTLLFGELLAGAVLTEQVFTIPGFGKLIVDAVFNRDYGVVQGVVLCTAIGFIADEPARRRPLHPDQPAAEDRLMTASPATDLPDAAAPQQRSRALAQVPAQPLGADRRRASCSPSC